MLVVCLSAWTLSPGNIHTDCGCWAGSEHWVRGGVVVLLLVPLLIHYVQYCQHIFWAEISHYFIGQKYYI